MVKNGWNELIICTSKGKTLLQLCFAWGSDIMTVPFRKILLFAFNRETWTFFRACLFFKRDSFPDNCVDWTSEHVSFEARNYECLPNVARFVHVECRFDKIKDIFQGFGTLVSLWLQKDGGAKRKQIWTNLSHWNCAGSRQDITDYR